MNKINMDDLLELGIEVCASCGGPISIIIIILNLLNIVKTVSIVRERIHVCQMMNIFIN
tara:strand:+ start:105 stop:281 length:177 start_codon:yes stop_codon:yes gene_type:complete